MLGAFRCCCCCYWVQGTLAIMIARLRIGFGRMTSSFLFNIALLVAHIANIAAIAKWHEVGGLTATPGRE